MRAHGVRDQTTDRTPTNHHHESDDDRDRQQRIAEALARSDRQALADAYQRWGTMIHALCTRWAGPEAADDLTQQVFVAAWHSRETYDAERGPLGAWLVGIARNVTNRSFRGIREVPVDPGDVARDDRAEPDRSTAIADELLLADALAHLPESQRHTLQLSYWEGLTQAEVAERLDMPLGTVKSHQRRGLQRLRDSLGGER